MKRIAAAFQAEPGDPKLDARSYVAGFKMGVKIGLQDAAYSTYADNIESAGRPVEDLRDLDSREGERWHE